MDKIVEQAQTLVDKFINEQQITEFVTHVSENDKDSLRLPNKEARDIVWECGDEDYELVINRPFEHYRWEVDYYCIAKRKSDNTYWDFSYTKGATESQDVEPFEHEGDIISIPQVFPHLKAEITYI